MVEGKPSKICVLCGQDCSDRPRIKDPKGHYYCKSCHEPASQRQRAQAATNPPAEPALDPYILAGVGEAAASNADAAETAPGTATCPSCERPLPPGAKVCVTCGINVDTGRSIVTSRRLDENLVYANTERVLRPVSWINPVGLFPVASEAMGGRKPYATWAVTVLTVVVTFWFWFSSDAQMNQRKDLMLWAGDAQPSADLIMYLYQWTDYGDEIAFHASPRSLRSWKAAARRRFAY